MMQQAKPEQTFLKVQKRIDEIRTQYSESQSQHFNILVTGDSGTGKTSLLATCPTPVFIDSFDPGGTKTQVLQEGIANGSIIVDDRWESDSWKKPHVFRAWEREFMDRKAEGFFDYIGTYAIDSITKWADYLMHAIIATGNKKTGPRPGTIPEIQDYLIQQLTTVDYLSSMMGLPCNVLVTGHIGYDKDELSGRMQTGLLVAGKLSNKIPIMFDEHYITRVIENRSSKGTETNYMVLTQNDGFYKAKSRIGGSKLEAYETPDIRAIMKKAGRLTEDREPITSP